MKKFTFSLQTVLEVRRIFEQQHKDHLVVIESQIAYLQNELQQLQQELARADQELKDKLNKGTSGQMIMSFNLYFGLLDSRMDKKKDEIRKAQEERSRTQRLLVQAMRDRKVMERLREKQEKDYQVEVNREEERIISEFLSNKVAADRISGAARR